jgi:hypothetical protein
VDTDRLEDLGRFSVVFDSDGHTHTQSIFLYNKDKTELSWLFRKFLRGVFDLDDNCREFLEAMLGDNAEALHMLRGMKLEVDIQPGPGYIIDSDDGAYIAKDAQTGKPVSPQRTTVQGARQTAEAGGYKRSYNRMENVQSIYSEENFKALQNAREAVTQATAGSTLRIADLVTD